MPTGKDLYTELQEDEVEYYYSLLNEEITTYDCGSLCKDVNDGKPFCCITGNAVPYLYRKEFEYLKSRTDLWSVWKPITKHDINLKKNNEGVDTLFCQCKGVEFCERENRSVSCRTFPIEPYIDKRGVLVGLVFMKEFSHGCPLIDRPNDVRQDYIDSHYIFWEKLLLRRKEEYDTYLKSSATYRRSRSKTKQDFPILFPSHLKDKDYLRLYI